jgi:hypothetical protein
MVPLVITSLVCHDLCTEDARKYTGSLGKAIKLEKWAE